MSTGRRGHENGAYSDGDDEREEEDGEEGEEDAEEEPRLKYQRLGGSVPVILSTDAAAAIAVADRMVALGTHNGTLHILDFQGNQVPFATGRLAGLGIAAGAGVGRCALICIVGIATLPNLRLSLLRPLALA
jgi:vacuolar protein sorting-associated protein 41